MWTVNYKQCESVPQGVSSPLAMSTGSEKLLGNSLAVLKKKVLEIFTKPKLCVCAVMIGLLNKTE